jgi:hypothetical protein
MALRRWISPVLLFRQSSYPGNSSVHFADLFDHWLFSLAKIMPLRDPASRMTASLSLSLNPFWIGIAVGL